jgi:hypothetical protein
MSMAFPMVKNTIGNTTADIMEMSVAVDSNAAKTVDADAENAMSRFFISFIFLPLGFSSGDTDTRA